MAQTATFTSDVELKLATNKDADIETVTFHAGDTAHIVKTWDRFFLIKDDNGHYYNVPKDKIQLA